MRRPGLLTFGIARHLHYVPGILSSLQYFPSKSAGKQPGAISAMLRPLSRAVLNVVDPHIPCYKGIEQTGPDWAQPLATISIWFAAVDTAI